MPVHFDGSPDNPLGYFVFHSASQRLCVEKNSPLLPSKPGPQMPVHFDGSPDNPLGYFVFHSASQRLCVEKTPPLLPGRRLSLQYHLQNIVLPQLVAFRVEV
jgi:hypothetical protein